MRKNKAAWVWSACKWCSAGARCGRCKAPGNSTATTPATAAASWISAQFPYAAERVEVESGSPPAALWNIAKGGLKVV